MGKPRIRRAQIRKERRGVGSPTSTHVPLLIESVCYLAVSMCQGLSNAIYNGWRRRRWSETSAGESRVILVGLVDRGRKIEGVMGEWEEEPMPTGSREKRLPRPDGQ
jgi:hypothetical protein